MSQDYTDPDDASNLFERSKILPSRLACCQVEMI